jgi:signal transduction histidine kinase
MYDERLSPESLAIDPGEVQIDRLGIERRFALLEKQIQRLQKLAALGTMSAVLAHELNNLLTPILGFCQMAAERKDERTTAAAIEKTLSYGRHAAALCQKIMGMATDEADEAPAVTELRPLVEDAVECVARDFSKDGIAVAVEVAPGLAARVHAASIKQVLFNLILNARQAMIERRGHLTITAQRCGDHMVRLSVRDSGPGIAAELLPKIFEPFFSTKTRSDRPDRRGLGLGLFVSKKLVEESGGKLTVESTPGDGATFTLWLPPAD